VVLPIVTASRNRTNALPSLNTATEEIANGMVGTPTVA
jgi:hypothetical protein